MGARCTRAAQQGYRRQSPRQSPSQQLNNKVAKRQCRKKVNLHFLPLSIMFRSQPPPSGAGDRTTTPKQVLGAWSCGYHSLVGKARNTRNDIRRRLHFRRELRSRESKARSSLNVSQLKEAEYLLQRAKDISERVDACLLNNTPRNVDLLYELIDSEEGQQHE